MACVCGTLKTKAALQVKGTNILFKTSATRKIFENLENTYSTDPRKVEIFQKLVQPLQ